MEPSAFACWLDQAFERFDVGVLTVVHSMYQSSANVALDPLSRFFALIGHKGFALILLGLLLLAFPRTRKYGAGVLAALAMGALCTNVLIKPLVSRARPYADEARALYGFWLEAGGQLESDASFPSGHATAMTASMSALFFLGDKRRSWVFLLPAVFMCFTRLCLVVHYPTDVIAGALIGLLAGLLAAALVKRYMEKRRDPAMD